MKRWLLGVGLLLANLTNAHADIITQWNFNGPTSTTVPGGANSPTPSIGVGVASLVGGVTAATTFSSGTANGGSSDPVLTTPNNYGWQTTGYATNAADNSAGVQFSVSTVGYEDITINWDTRHSNTSSRFQRLLYTLDGTTWINSNFFEGAAGDTWFNNRTVNLSGIAAADNNSNFGIRIVSTLNGSPGYTASTTGNTFANTGTWRFDMVTVNGVTAVPEPSSFALLSLVGIGGFALRRLRKGRAG